MRKLKYPNPKFEVNTNKIYFLDVTFKKKGWQYYLNTSLLLIMIYPLMEINILKYM